MNQLIQLLPDNIANQIAAGEVVQRPASVVKELLENAIDAGATRIELNIRDAGKGMIQVIDNGSGMSALDARMAFERHATSKIRTTKDLFNIHTMGFRGEALASIAAVAQVELKTRLHDMELGTRIAVEGNKVTTQEPTTCPAGTCFTIKNLFFNVPARRNFLKSNPVETRHILNEFIRIALSQPGIHLLFNHNDTKVHDLDIGDTQHRITNLFGSNLEGNLIYVGEETPYIQISGWVGHPQAARKTRGEQFFFVNSRFIKSPYLNHAVSNAFEGLIPTDKYPFYCLFLEIDPQHVDINIHPTKTEVKFDDEKTVYSILRSIIKKGLGALHGSSDLDFGDDTMVKIIENVPPPKKDGPTISNFSLKRASQPKLNDEWEKLFQTPTSKPRDPSPLQNSTSYSQPQEFPPSKTDEILQLHQQYIVLQSEDGLKIINQHLAHKRVLYEQFINAVDKPPLASQQLLFPQNLDFSSEDSLVLQELLPELRQLGFDLSPFGKQTFMVQGLPSGVPHKQSRSILDGTISMVKESDRSNAKEKIYHNIALSIATHAAIPSQKSLNQAEIQSLLQQLWRCKHPGVSPEGKPTYYEIKTKQLQQHFS